MHAARILAKQGNRVSLYESASELGGQMRYSSKVATDYGYLVTYLKGRVSRMDDSLSRSKNGAVNVGNTDLILPVRVRTCAENVGKTPGAFPLRGSVASAFQHMERSEEARQRYSEGWRVGLNDVRASALTAKHET